MARDEDVGSGVDAAVGNRAMVSKTAPPLNWFPFSYSHSVPFLTSIRPLFWLAIFYAVYACTDLTYIPFQIESHAGFSLRHL